MPKFILKQLLDNNLYFLFLHISCILHISCRHSQNIQDKIFDKEIKLPISPHWPVKYIHYLFQMF